MVPSLVLVPFESGEDVPPDFEQQVTMQVADAMKQRGFRTLAPFSVRAVGPEAGLDDVVAHWVDAKGRSACGFIVGIDGPASDGLWGIAEQGVIIGRGPEADVRFLDPGLSRRHLSVKIVEEGKLLLEDLGSHNGTRLGRKTLTQPVSVSSGARVTLGNSVLKLWTIPNTLLLD